MTTHRADYNPAPRIGRETREEIKALGISLDDYVANVEGKLRARGENALANRMLDEIRESAAQTERYRDEAERDNWQQGSSRGLG